MACGHKTNASTNIHLTALCSELQRVRPGQCEAALWHVCSLQKALSTSTLHLNLAQPTHRQEGQSAFLSSFPSEQTNRAHISCGQVAVASEDPEARSARLHRPPAPDSARQGPARQSLCRLRVLPVATRAAQLSPLNLNCSTPDSAAERTFSSPERALTPKPEGESCAHSWRVALRWPLRRPSRAGFSSGLTLLVPLTPLSPQVATQDCRGPDSCPGTATLSPSS